MTKKALRQRLLRRLRQQPKSQRLAKSLKISRALKGLSLYRRSKRILCYVAIDGEVETRSLIAQALAQGKQVAVPVVSAQHKRLIAARIADVKELTRRGPLGIPRPSGIARRRIDPRRLDLIVVPGIAFDRQGRRLGRGGGYFDRFLSGVPPAIPSVGLAFRFQVVRSIPWESHDRRVSRVITE